MTSTASWLAGASVAFMMSTGAYAGGGDGSQQYEPPSYDASGLRASALMRPEGQGDQRHPVEARLLLEKASVAPGDSLVVGVQLIQDKDWHTYWKTPGDIGLPTDVEFTLPEGATVGPQRYPIPVRYEAEGMISFGYDDQVLHIFEIELPEDIAPGEYPLTADVSWLVCKTSCIPGEATLSTEFMVGEASEAGAAGELFEHFRNRWPEFDVAKAGVSIETVYSTGDTVPVNSDFSVAFKVTPLAGHELTVPTEMWPTFAAVMGPDWFQNEARVQPLDGGGFAVVIDGTTFQPEPIPEYDAVGGLFTLEVDGETHKVEHVTAFPWAAEGATAGVASADPVFTAPAKSEPVAAAEAPSEAAETAPAPADSTAGGFGAIISNLLLAFVGGFILNAMPCVLPVLTLKLYGLVEQAGISNAQKKSAGLAYTGGIIVSFWGLALAVWVLRSMLGNDVGWGFQMQYPGYVAGLATLVFIFGLSLFGVFEIPALGANSASEFGAKEGTAGYFFTGVFATLVATPCSAPFLGTAIAFAFQAPTWLLTAVFTMIGLGLAFPFLVIAFFPAAYRLLPQPGAWMDTFKQLLGFTLVGTTIWLVSVLFAQIGTDNGINFLIFLTIASFGAWLFGHYGGVGASRKRQGLALLAAIVIGVVGGMRFLTLDFAEAATCDDEPVVLSDLNFDEEIPWQNFSDKRVEELEGKLIFADFTAEWCVSCKVNEKTVLETETVRSKMAELGVVPLKADWTNKDPQITAWLKRFERAGVPLYLVIPPSGQAQAVALPELITPNMVVEALEKHGT